MRVHLLQMDLAWEDKAANHTKARNMLRAAGSSPGDLVVLPEMFDTGFSFKIERTLDTDDATLRFLIGLAREFEVTVHGGRTVLAPDGVHGLNRCEVVGPTGAVLASYDKLHPFSYGRESERFVGGEQVTTYPWRASGWDDGGGAASGAPNGALLVCPGVCYDLRFPELFRRGLDLGAEAFALGANWPSARAEHWRVLAIARAVENQAFVFAVNRVGRDPALSYPGGSLVIGPRGDVLAELGAAEDTASVAIDAGSVHAWREEFPAWRDRSPVLRDAGRRGV